MHIVWRCRNLGPTRTQRSKNTTSSSYTPIPYVYILQTCLLQSILSTTSAAGAPAIPRQLKNGCAYQPTNLCEELPDTSESQWSSCYDVKETMKQWCGSPHCTCVTTCAITCKHPECGIKEHMQRYGHMSCRMRHEGENPTQDSYGLCNSRLVCASVLVPLVMFTRGHTCGQYCVYYRLRFRKQFMRMLGTRTAWPNSCGRTCAYCTAT
jgi:hypothetical protein